MAWSKVQDSRQNAGTGTSGTFAYPSNIGTGGRLLIVLAFYNHAGAQETFSVSSDTQSLTWTQLFTLYSANTQQTITAFAAYSPSGGAESVHLAWTAGDSNGGDIVLLEFSGITGGLAVDGTPVTALSANNSSPAVNSPSYTPGVTGDLVISLGMTDNNIPTVGTPWTAGDANMSQTGDAWGWLTGSLSAVTANMTLGSAAYWGNAVFAIKASGSGGPASATASDTAQLSDSASRSGQAFARTASDTVAASDAATRGASGTRSSADTLALSDAAVRSAGIRTRSTSDTAAASDAATRGIAAARSSSDTAALSDAAIRSVSAARSTSDTATLTDSAANGSGPATRSSADTLALSDAATRAASQRTRTASDTAAASDVASRAWQPARTANETLALTDTATRISRNISRTATDAIVLTDSASQGHQSARTSSDTLALADSAFHIQPGGGNVPANAIVSIFTAATSTTTIDAMVLVTIAFKPAVDATAAFA
jgi:hypothetical protein